MGSQSAASGGESALVITCAEAYIETLARTRSPAHAPHRLAPMTAKPNLTLVSSPRSLPSDHVERNPGMPLDLDVVRSIRVNRSAVERRAATIPTRRTVKR